MKKMLLDLKHNLRVKKSFSLKRKQQKQRAFITRKFLVRKIRSVFSSFSFSVCAWVNKINFKFLLLCNIVCSFIAIQMKEEKKSYNENLNAKTKGLCIKSWSGLNTSVQCFSTSLSLALSVALVLRHAAWRVSRFSFHFLLLLFCCMANTR